MVKIPGVIKTTAWAAIASAATVDMTAATGNVFDISGNTTILAFSAMDDGITFDVTLTWAPLITYNATNLKVPGSANIQGTAGDTFRLRSLGSGNYRITDYTRVNGKAVVETDYSSPISLYDSTYFPWETGSAGQAVFIESVTPFASATSEQYVGDVVNNTRKSFPVFWTGVSWSTIELSIKKFASPSAAFSVRIETDNAGSPSGTLAHANAYGTVSAWTVTTSFVDTTITLNGAFTLTAWVKYHVVVFAGTYASETINSTNFYAIWFSTVNSTTRFGKHYNGSIWTTGVGEVISESGAFTEAGGNSDTASIWFRILANTNCYITSATISTNTSATRLRIFTDAGTLLWTATIISKVGTFSPAIALVSWDYYRIEADNSGASYQTYFDSSPTYPTGTNINYITGSQDQANAAHQRNITHISTVTQTKYFFPYTSSELFHDYVLSLTDADYTYKTDYLGVLSEAMVLWGNPKVVVSGIDSNQSLSWVALRADLYLSNTPWGISSTPGTNEKLIGIKHSDTKILVEKKPTLKTSTSGVSSGTAETDIFVNAYGTWNGWNTTLIGSSNGNTVASCSTWNLWGTPVFSIFFPVKSWASWSVTGSMTGITVWVTPLS